MMENLSEVYIINWNAVSAVASCFEILLVLVPALFFFLYYKISYLDCWIYKQNENGMQIVLHNKSSSSIFILKEILIVKSDVKKEHILPIDAFSKINSIQILPDNFVILNVDFGLYNITPACDVVLQLECGGKKRKTIKLQKKKK